MQVCFSCRRVSPAGSRYCDGCGLGLGVRICEDFGHTNALNAEACRVCGSDDLSDGTRSMSLLPLCRVLTLVLGMSAWKYLTAPNAGVILSAAGTGAVGAAAFLTNTTAAGLAEFLRAVVGLLVMLWLLGVCLYPLPERGGSAGRLLRGMPLALLRWLLLSALPRALRVGCHALLRLFFVGGRKAEGGDHGSPYNPWGNYGSAYRGRGGWRS